MDMLHVLIITVQCMDLTRQNAAQVKVQKIVKEHNKMKIALSPERLN
jgi:hypothetical protein